MIEYSFKGNWKDELELNYFTRLDSNKFNSSPKDLLKSGKVPFLIWDERTMNPDPLEEQINALNFILKNEEKVYKSLFNSLKEVIIPDAKKYYDLENEDEEIIQNWFPKINSIDDMKEIVGIYEIQIEMQHKNGIAWTSFLFDFSADQEHGLKMTFEGDNFLNFSDSDGNTLKEIMTKHDYQKYQESLVINYPYQIFKPDSKYGVLKPWQAYANEYYPIGILREGRKQELIDYLSNNLEVAKVEMETLLVNSTQLRLDEITYELNELKKKL